MVKLMAESDQDKIGAAPERHGERRSEVDYDYFGCAIPPTPPLWPRIVAALNRRPLDLQTLKRYVRAPMNGLRAWHGR
jgi:hypothetical protein